MSNTLFSARLGNLRTTVTKLEDNGVELEKPFLGFVWRISTEEVLAEDRFDDLLDACTTMYLLMNREYANSGRIS